MLATRCLPVKSLYLLEVQSTLDEADCQGWDGPFGTEEEMPTTPLEVRIAFEVIAAGGLLILLGYIINRWGK